MRSEEFVKYNGLKGAYINDISVLKNGGCIKMILNISDTADVRYQYKGPLTVLRTIRFNSVRNYELPYMSETGLSFFEVIDVVLINGNIDFQLVDERYSETAHVLISAGDVEYEETEIIEI